MGVGGVGEGKGERLDGAECGVVGGGVYTGITYWLCLSMYVNKQPMSALALIALSFT